MKSAVTAVSNRRARARACRLGCCFGRVLLLLLASMASIMAQTTTNFTATLEIRDQGADTYARVFVGNGAVGNLGSALLILNRNQNLGDDYNSGVGPVGGSLTLAFNRQDQITMSIGPNPDPEAATVTLPATVSGTGAFAGATGPAGTRVTLTRTSLSPLTYSVRFIGPATVGGQPLDLAITDVPVVLATTNITVADNQTGTAVFTPFGNATISGRSRPDTNRWDDSLNFIEISITFTFSQADSLRAFLTFDAKTEQPSPILIAGGTGRFAGASGTAMITNIVDGNGGEPARVTIAGTLTQAGPTTPIITFVNTTSGLNQIAQNDWIEIKGTNLVPRTTPAGGMFWSNAPEFAQGRMPTELGGISVTVNGKPAYVYWFCSAATTPDCPTDQINVLTPLDDYVGLVQIVVKNGSETSAPFLRFKNPAMPTFLLFSAKGHAVATHLDGSLLGPATLFPGASTPARRGETITLWGVGFGLPTTPLTDGSSTQRGSLPATLSCTLGGSPVQVASALISPGLYQFNVTVSDNMAAGERHFYCTYGEFLTLGVLVAVQ